MRELKGNVLAVLSADENPRDALDSELIHRATDLVSRVQGKLLLLKICYDSSLSYGAFASRDVIDQARLQLLEADNAHMEELRKQLKKHVSIEIGTSVRWGYDNSAEILKVARASEAGMIMKQRGKQTYIMGLFTTTDWELLRDSNVPVWFVAGRDSVNPTRGVIAAIDQVDGEGEEAGEAAFRLDDRVYHYAFRTAATYGAPLHLVHAYRLPRSLGYEGYLPSLVPESIAQPPTTGGPISALNRRARREVARRHGQAIREFVEEQGIDPDEMIIAEGSVDNVLRETAEEKGAGLIVMGANNRDRWDRLLGQVNAEPTLDRSPCDILFVKPSEAC